DERGGDSADDEKRPGNSTVERSVTPKVDEARGTERAEKQRVSKRLKSGPNGSQKQTRAIDEHKRCCPETHRGWSCAAASRQDVTAHTFPFLPDTRRIGNERERAVDSVVHPPVACFSRR